VINTINQTSSFPSNKQLLTGENFQTIHTANTDRIGSLH